ncbi:MAG: hypothetical protein MHPSP_002868, partial [Paramarteilia canceri]
HITTLELIISLPKDTKITQLKSKSGVVEYSIKRNFIRWDLTDSKLDCLHELEGNATMPSTRLVNKPFTVAKVNDK